MTFDEWLVDECGPNNGWTYFERENTRRAWNAAKREALLEAAGMCDELEVHYSGYAATALLNDDLQLGLAASGEPRATRFIGEKIRKMAGEIK